MNRLLLATILATTAMASDAPTIGSLTLNPSIIAMDKPTVVTATATISDPSAMPNSVNLIRLSGKGQPTILGAMHDDGLNGDASAGDHIYSLQTAFTGETAGTIDLRASVVFKGFVKRSLSPVSTLQVR